MFPLLLAFVEEAVVSAFGVCVRIFGAEPGLPAPVAIEPPSDPGAMLNPLDPGWAGGCAVIAVLLKLEFKVPRFLTPRSLVFAWKLGEIPR